MQLLLHEKPIVTQGIRELSEVVCILIGASSTKTALARSPVPLSGLIMRSLVSSCKASF